MFIAVECQTLLHSSACPAIGAPANGSGRSVRRLIEPASIGATPCPSRSVDNNRGTRMARAILLGSIAATALFAPDIASAQTPSPSDPGSTAPVPQNGTGSRITTYDAAYFAPFAPRTALDIVRRVPGFQLDLGSTQTDLGQVDVRGFAGTAGHVVFNRARPTFQDETPGGSP